MAERALKLSGVERAAILLLALGEEHAAGILKHMGPKEVQKLGSAMATMRSVSTDQVNGVLTQFVTAAGTHTALGVDSQDYIRGALVQALGEEKAGGLMERILIGAGAHGIEALKWMEGRAVAEMIRVEHPQVVAIVLSYLEGEQAAEIVGHLPARMRTDVLMRIATLDAVQPAALQELNNMLESQVAGANNLKSTSVGGIQTAADIFNFLDSSVESELMEELKEMDPGLGQQIQDLMFVFDNLVELDNVAIQHVLREVSSESLLTALKGADEAMRDKIFTNMSKRAAEMLMDDLETKGPVRLSEVEAAQKEIVGIARRMAEEGQISLGGKGAEELIG